MNRMKTMLVGIALVFLSGTGLLVAPADAQSTIGPGTPCTFTVLSPTTNADGTPLTLPLLEYRFYLDPPVGGPVIGTTAPFFKVPISGGTIGTNPSRFTASVCKNMPTPITTGNHTASFTAVDAAGESLGSLIVPFVFVGTPPAPPGSPTFN